MKRLISIVLLLVLLQAIAYADGDRHFLDVQRSDWYFEAVQRLQTPATIMGGYADGNFRPERPISYIEALKSIIVIVNQADLPVDDTLWYRPYLSEALRLKIVDIKQLSDIHRPIRREELAYWVSRALTISPHLHTDRPQTELPYDIVDRNAISPRVIEHVLNCYRHGVMAGYADRAFHPTDVVSRAQAAVVFQRLIDPSARVKPPLALSKDSVIPRIVDVDHYAGQTFIAFKEVLAYQWQQVPSYRELATVKQQYNKHLDVRYLLYRSRQPITDLSTLKPVRQVAQFSGWNDQLHGINTKEKEDRAATYRYGSKRRRLNRDEGLFVITADANDEAYYAVGVEINGILYPVLDARNTTSAIVENLNVSQPVLQMTIDNVSFYGVKPTQMFFYTRWETADTSAIADRPFDYLVVKPQMTDSGASVGIHLHGWDGSLMSGYGPWTRQTDNTIFVSTNQYPYDWWTGYHEKHYQFKTSIFERSQDDYVDTVVRPYSVNRVFSFVDWLATSKEWSIDTDRVYAVGNSMGGSGAAMMAIRHPDRIAWVKSEVGVHNPAQSPEYRLSYARVYGRLEHGAKFYTGESVWDYYNDSWYLRQHVATGLGLIVYSNGKNDANIGWSQAVAFTQALQETRQPHIFYWGQDGHRQVAKLPINHSTDNMVLDLNSRQSLPAFTQCSLDDDFGTGDIESGTAAGQVNAYLAWDPTSIKETSDSWQLPVYLIKAAPQDTCTVDITPRKLTAFVLQPNQIISWELRNSTSQTPVASGQAVVDADGLVTIQRVPLSKTMYTLILHHKER